MLWGLFTFCSVLKSQPPKWLYQLLLPQIMGTLTSHMLFGHNVTFPAADYYIYDETGFLQKPEVRQLQSLSHVRLGDPMNCSTPGFPVHHQLPELAQTHVHQVSDAIQPSHPLSSLSLPDFNLLQHQGLFQWVSSSHQVAKVLEFQLQHQSLQWTPRTDLL